jgi:DNA-binding response OmpR family regulator
MAGDQPDRAIEKGLAEAGCKTQLTRSIAATMAALQAMRDTEGASTLLVAEVQAGGIPLLALLQEQRVEVPAILVFDRNGSDIHTVVKALKYGASDYLLASDPDFQREIRARILAERAAMQSHKPARRSETPAMGAARAATSTLMTMPDFHWDPAIHVIYVGSGYLRLSPVEGRMFDLLLSRRNRTVLLEELIAVAFNRPNMDVNQGVKLLRPHMMRLRNKLEQFPELSHRIINLRGSGYMFI